MGVGLLRTLNMPLKGILRLLLVNMPQGVSLLSIRRYIRVADCIQIRDRRDMSIIRQNTISQVKTTRNTSLSAQNVIGSAMVRKNIQNALTAMHRWNGIQRLSRGGSRRLRGTRSSTKTRKKKRHMRKHHIIPMFPKIRKCKIINTATSALQISRIARY